MSRRWRRRSRARVPILTQLWRTAATVWWMAGWILILVAILSAMSKLETDPEGAYLNLGIVAVALVIRFWGLQMVRALGRSISRWLMGRRVSLSDDGQRTLARHVDQMTGPQFEQFVAALLARDGWSRVQVSGGAGDLGADVIAWNHLGQKLVVQCKRYGPNLPVTSPDVQRLAGTMHSVHAADLAWIVTTGRITAPALALCAQVGIHPVDRDALADWTERALVR